ncbi:ABC transporter permease [Enterococcus sp. DIV1298c]|uniref:ABC transporter permease n=1 Tax=Enterococcus sp. DIV1298c TaxID=2815328 RepID=UPI001A933A69|nr:ABC transporter permease [Enterococcus sp. DIV1298c]MBO0460487.1 ABC transporter permease [Enterococcus sp. DIV1298c]
MNKKIIIRTLIQSLREKSNYIYFVAFPITLMFILGAVLQGVFNNDFVSDIEPLTVQYQIDDPEVRGIFQQVTSFTDGTIHFEEVANKKEGLANIRKQTADAYLSFSDHVEVQSRELSNVEKTILQSYLVEIVQEIKRQSIIMEQQLPPTTGLVSADQFTDAIVIDQENQRETATSYQYYAIAMISLFVLYFSETGLSMFREARQHGTVQRELVTPLSRKKIILSTFFGHFVFGMCVVLLLMLLSQFLFDVPWYLRFGFSYFNLVALMGSFLALGLFLETVGDRGEKRIGSSTTQIFIQLTGFLGGAYFPTNETMMRFSPLGWVLASVRESLWTDNPLHWVGIYGNVGILLVLLTLSVVILDKREVF